MFILCLLEPNKFHNVAGYNACYKFKNTIVAKNEKNPLKAF